MPFSAGRIELSLTSTDPHRHCTFTNNFTANPPPEPSRPQPVSPEANLVLSKRATSATVKFGGVITYKLGVVNRGPDPAEEVTLLDQPLSASHLLSASSDRGSCTNSVPLSCDLGTLAPGARASLTVRLRPAQPGSFINHAVAGTSTLEADPASAQARAAVRVKPPKPAVAPIRGLG